MRRKRIAFIEDEEYTRTCDIGNAAGTVDVGRAVAPAL